MENAKAFLGPKYPFFGIQQIEVGFFLAYLLILAYGLAFFSRQLEE